MIPGILKKKIDSLYDQYNRRRYVHPDPLECLYSYENIKFTCGLSLDDPVKYDFVLTHMGIRDDMDMKLICP